MESSSCSDFHYWNDLPNEIKTMVIRNMTNNSRLALRACSRSNQELVDSIPFRKIYRFHLCNEEDGWSIGITRSTYNIEITSKFATFNEFQKKLTQEIENSDFIQKMTISNTYIEKPLNLLRFGKLVKVGKICFKLESSYSSHILEQIDPNQVKKLEFAQQILEPEVLDIVQMASSNLRILGVNFIQDDQLLNLEGSELYLWNCVMLTDTGINKFLQKCVANLDLKQIDFDISCRGTKCTKFLKDLDIASSEEKGKVLINSPSGNLQLEIQYSDGFVSGKTIGLKRKRGYETMEFMQIDRYVPNKRRVLRIGHRNGSRVRYEFDSAEDLQRKITAELESTNYIKTMRIYDPTYNWKFTSSNKDRLAVGILLLSSGGNYDIDYLKQIEPIHLKEISIGELSRNEQIYDLPQVIHVEKLFAYRSLIRDEQLLKLNVKWLDLQTDNHETTCNNLTDSGIKAFVKKSLVKLNQHDLYFRISSLGNRRNSSTIFDGLDCSSQNLISKFERKLIVNSPYPDFQLELRCFHSSFIGKRVRNALL